MKKIMALMIVLFMLTVGCAGTQQALEPVTEGLESSVEMLAMDWPKASGAIRGGLDEGYLPQNIIDKMDEVDSWWKDDQGNWIPADEMVLTTYQKWYIAGVRASHTGPVLQAIIRQYAPGLLNLPQVMAGLSFLGLGIF